MKHYAAATHAVRSPGGAILDLGCGAGHDLEILTSMGLRFVGVDPSAVMLQAAQERVPAVPGLVRGLGEMLPFRDAAFSGCRIERVLMHVDDPGVVLAEARRCLEPGGLITVLEPDWSSFVVRSEVLPDRADWLSAAKHPAMGAELWGLLEELGFRVLDQVEELSIWRSLQRLERVAGFPATVERAVARGRIEERDAKRWIEEQRQLQREGNFYAQLSKFQVVAERR